MKLHHLIFLGLLAGVAIGYGLWLAAPPGEAAPAWRAPALWVLDLLGQALFVGALKMLIAPLIFASIVAAVTSLPRVEEIGAIGVKTLVFYAITLTLAMTVALLMVLVIQPGRSHASLRERERRAAQLDTLRVEYERETGAAPLADGQPTARYRAWLEQNQSGAAAADPRFAAAQRQSTRTPAEVFKEEIVLGMLRNPFSSLTTGNALGIIFFALLLGIACTAIGEAGRPLAAVFAALAAAMLKMTHWIMMAAPLAVLCIMARLVAETGPDIFRSLAWYCSTVIGAISIHVVVLVTLTWTVGRIDPLTLWRGIREAMLIAFTTRSSAATLPVSLACVIDNLKVSPKVANFALPVGATVNMDGTAAHQAISVIFLIQMYGGLDDAPVTLDAFTILVVAAMSSFAAIGAAPMPNAGLIIMAMVAGAAGLPVYYLPLIFAVDSVLDMFRTLVNVLGDLAGAVVVNRIEGPRLRE